MTRISPKAIVAIVAAGLAILAGRAISADKYTVQVPGGLAFSDVRGYEDWPVISTSDNGGKFAAILGNPVMMAALRAGVPGNGKPFPDGAKMAKIHWTPKTQADVPRSAEGAGYPGQRRFHGEGQQAVRGEWRMGMGLIRLRRRVRYVQPRDRGGHAAAEPRREVRVCVPHDREGKRLRFHRVRAQVKRSPAAADGAKPARFSRSLFFRKGVHP